MFSREQKKHVVALIEKILLGLDHPEMPKEKVRFKLHVDGAESWSWADIEPNWIFDNSNPPIVNPFNETMAKKISFPCNCPACKQREKIEDAIRREDLDELKILLKAD